MLWIPSNLSVMRHKIFSEHHRHHNLFTALFPGPPGWASARRELLDFMVQGKINKGRHTDHLAGCHSIRTKQCPPPPSTIFYRPDALPAAQPTVSKHWRQLVHSDLGEDARVLLSSVSCTVSVSQNYFWTQTSKLWQPYKDMQHAFDVVMLYSVQLK